MNNTRFSTSIHIMILMAKFPNEWLKSDFIANSISINPVMVRKEISTLQRAGLIEGRKGKEGGARLAKPAERITLSSIYFAVKQSETLGRLNTEPNEKCSVGIKINDHLKELNGEVDEAIYSLLESRSLADFADKF